MINHVNARNLLHENEIVLSNEIHVVKQEISTKLIYGRHHYISEQVYPSSWDSCRWNSSQDNFYTSA